MVAAWSLARRAAFVWCLLGGRPLDSGGASDLAISISRDQENGRDEGAVQVFYGQRR